MTEVCDGDDIYIECVFQLFWDILLAVSIFKTNFYGKRTK